MAVNKVQLEREDHERDAAFKQAMHGKTAAQDAGFMAMLKKNKEGQQMAVDEYFKFWDGKGAGQETDADMKVRLGIRCHGWRGVQSRKAAEQNRACKSLR